KRHERRERDEFAALHPGGSKAPRAWHADRFAQLARVLHEEMGLVPLVVGDAADASSGEEIARAGPGGLVAAGRARLRAGGAPSGKPHCLEGITVEAVAAACRRVLAVGGNGPRR